MRTLCEAAVDSEKDWGQPWGSLDSEARQPDRPTKSTGIMKLRIGRQEFLISGAEARSAFNC